MKFCFALLFHPCGGCVITDCIFSYLSHVVEILSESGTDKTFGLSLIITCF